MPINFAAPQVLRAGNTITRICALRMRNQSGEDWPRLPAQTFQALKLHAVYQCTARFSSQTHDNTTEHGDDTYYHAAGDVPPTAREVEILTGPSAKLAYALSMLTNDLDILPVWTDEEIEVWATGDLRKNGKLRSVTDFPIKAQAFFSEQVSARVFLAPWANGSRFYPRQRKYELPDGSSRPAWSVRDFAAWANRETRENLPPKLIVFARDLDELVAAFFEPHTRVPAHRRERHHVRFVTTAALTVATLVAVTFSILRWSVLPPCIPMDFACFQTGQPRFASNEFGILVPKRAFADDISVRAALQDLTSRTYDAYKAAVANAPAYRLDPGKFVPLRIVAVDAVDEAAIAETQAALGFSGSLDLQQHPGTGKRDYLLRNATIILNLRALSGHPVDATTERRPGFLKIPAQQYPQYPLLYRDPSVRFYPSLLAAIFGLSPTPRDSAGTFETRDGKTLKAQISRLPPERAHAVQNLNRSLNSEFAVLESGATIPPAIRVLAGDELPSRDFIIYALGLLAIRITVDSIFPHGYFSDPVFPDRISSTDFKKYNATLAVTPPFFQALSWRLEGDVRLALYSAFRRQATFDGPLAPGQAAPLNFDVADWALWAHDAYAHLDAFPGISCPDCYAIRAQLLYVAGNYKTLIDELKQATEHLTGSDRNRFVYLHAKMSAGLTPKPVSKQLLNDILTSFETLRDTAFEVLADFETARVHLTLGEEEESFPRAVAALRRVLVHRPKHALSRFLLAKLLRHSTRLRASDEEAITMYFDLLRDLNDTHGNYSEPLHSLGVEDVVHHSVSSKFVAEDLIQTLFVQCNEQRLTEALHLAHDAHAISISRIRRLLSQERSETDYFIFPSEFIQGLLNERETAVTCNAAEHLRTVATDLLRSFRARKEDTTQSIIGKDAGARDSGAAPNESRPMPDLH